MTTVSVAIAIATAGLWGAPAVSAELPEPISQIPESRRLIAEDPLAEEVRHLDPGVDGWNTEELTLSAGRRLHELSGLFAHPPTRWAGELESLVTADVSVQRWRPRQLAPVFEGSEIRVATGLPDAERLTGADGLAVALSGLLEQFGGGTAYASMKIIGVGSVSDRAFTTDVLARFRSTGDDGVFQADATWRIEWLESEHDGPPRISRLDVSGYTESRTAAPWFVDSTAAVLGAQPAYRGQLLRGTDDWCARIDFAARMNQYGHNGIAVADVDNDGLDDVYVLQSGGLPNRLFRQRADGRAEDVSAEAGVDWLNESRAALFVDLDNNGAQDLLISTMRGVLVLRGDRAGRFELVGELPSRNGYSLAAADYDRDGLLDLYVTSYVQSGSGESLPAPYHDANNGEPNALYRNLGGLRFADVTEETGLDENNRRFSFAASWADYDRDGDLDLYVANDFGRNNLYRNTGGRFRDVARAAGVEDMAAGMGASWGDYDGDGELDLYVSNMFSSAGRRITYQRRFDPATGSETRSAFQRHARGNSLFANQGDGTFRDVTEEAGVWMGRWAWGAQFVDLNNDGLEDIFVPNGFFTNELTDDL